MLLEWGNTNVGHLRVVVPEVEEWIPKIFDGAQVILVVLFSILMQLSIAPEINLVVTRIMRIVTALFSSNVNGAFVDVVILVDFLKQISMELELEVALSVTEMKSIVTE